MKRPSSFLKDTKCVIFDMDGVITSEQNYWNCAALTVFEMLNDMKYFGNYDIEMNLTLDEIEQIRNEVFVGDKTIKALKNLGVNTNWDLAYVTLGAALIILFEQRGCLFNIKLRTAASTHSNSKQNIMHRFIKKILEQERYGNCLRLINYDTLSIKIYRYVYDYIIKLKLEAFELYSFISKRLAALTGMDEIYFSRNGEMWNVCQNIFQEWYLGEDAYWSLYGKKIFKPDKIGLMVLERPLFPIPELKEIFEVLTDAGISLGIGTGRQHYEISKSLESWGLEHYFDSDRYITYSDVLQAENSLGHIYKNINLSKPHPYMFLKGILGKQYPDQLIINRQFDQSIVRNCLIVGDAGSDIMAAKAIDCPFAAVLTGVSGQEAHEYFVKMQADFILDNVKELVC